jgi:hypothetical protein
VEVVEEPNLQNLPPVLPVSSLHKTLLHSVGGPIRSIALRSYIYYVVASNSGASERIFSSMFAFLFNKQDQPKYEQEM